nr:unnamed protein product [Callosobruchus chinensis]
MEFNIRTVNFVHENREKLIEVFEEIESRCEKSITSNEASGIRRALEDPEFIFWLELFHKILPQVDILYNQLQSKNKDTVQLQKDLIIFEKISDFSCQECNSTMTIVNKRRVVVEPEVLVIALKRYICNERMEP